MSEISFQFPSAGRSYNKGSGLKIDGFINSKDEISSLNNVLKSAFPKSTQGFRDNVIRDIACGAYTTKATTPSINALMVQLLRSLREEAPTTETSSARKWLISEIKAANDTGKSLESIFNEVCIIRYGFVSGAQNLLPYEDPSLSRISRTLYHWDYFPTLIKSPVNIKFKYPDIVSKIKDNKNISLDEFKLLTQTALAEKNYILGLPDGKETFPTRLSNLDTLLKTIQGITLLSPEQLLAYK